MSCKKKKKNPFQVSFLHALNDVSGLTFLSKKRMCFLPRHSGFSSGFMDPYSVV